MGTRRIRLALATAVSGLTVGALFAPAVHAGSPDGAAGSQSGHHTHTGDDGESDVTVCSSLVSPGSAFCHAHKRTDAKTASQRPSHHASASPNVLGNSGAYDPAFLQSAYNLAGINGGAGKTVAIVDAFDDPKAASDLAFYRNFFGIPLCSGGNGCLTKVDQRGGTAYPVANYGWAQEISLDLDMVSAICPKCNILLVEADSNSLADLGTAVNRAVAMGAMAVSNSYGAGEYSGETTDSQTYFNHPGVAVTASSGDSGYGVEFPAASRYVTAVGGTSLNQATNTGTRNATETAWSGAGSGCSAYEAKPTWQHDGGCSRRTVADVSAVADPNTGVWVYDTYFDPGFEVFGGTSVASPIIAATYALAGTPGAGDTPASYPYSTPTALNDITSGSNGSCGSSYLCTAKVGYDGPTGLGTPNSTPAFAPGVPPAGSLSLSAPQALTAGQPSTAMTVTVTPAPSSTINVSLASSSSQGSFATSSSGPWSATLSLPVTSSGSTSFYYQDTRAGSPTLTASATSYTPGTQTETVVAGSLARITLSPSSASVRVGSTVRFTASGWDAWNNPVGVTPSWSVSPTALGTFSSISGNRATFTGRNTGSGTVSATDGSITGTASITVRHR